MEPKSPTNKKETDAEVFTFDIPETENEKKGEGLDLQANISNTFKDQISDKLIDNLNKDVETNTNKSIEQTSEMKELDLSANDIELDLSANEITF